MPYANDGAWVPTIHHRHNAQDHPSCGTIGNTSVTDDWAEVTCKRCYKSDDWYAHYAAEQERTREFAAATDKIVREKTQAIFDTARTIADERGYCSTYQEIEAEIIAALGIEVTPSVREFEVEVEEEITVRIIRTITIEAESEAKAEEIAASQDSAEERIPSSLTSVFVEDGYHDSTEVEVISASAS